MTPTTPGSCDQDLQAVEASASGWVHVCSAALASPGTVGELDPLTAFDGRISLPDTGRAEVTTEPARTNAERLVADNPVVAQSIDTGWTEQAIGSTECGRCATALLRGSDVGDPAGR